MIKIAITLVIIFSVFISCSSELEKKYKKGFKFLEKNTIEGDKQAIKQFEEATKYAILSINQQGDVVKKWQAVRSALFNVKTAGWLLVSAALLGFNWGLFIWAVNNNHMLDASLGYYINPLLNVLLGVVFLSERLRKLQLFAVLLAVTGVVIQLVSFGSFPVIAFSLASSFAFYGLIRKK